MKTILTPFIKRPDTVRKLLRIAGASLLLTSLGQRAQAQFPRVESFKNSSATGFDLFGAAKLTGTEATGGTGYLRLTDAIGNQAGTAIDQSPFPAPQGFSISFEFFSYGKTSIDGADGFSVYLIDGTTSTFRIGADGGSLGYAQRIRESGTPTIVTPGVSNGYVGIGIDEFGNYSNSSEGRSGGLRATGVTPNAVTIRGSGNGSAPTDYPYLASSGQLGFNLDVTTAQAQEGSGDYRRAFIDFIPFVNTSGTTAYRITVRIQHGNTVTTALSNVEMPPPPPTLRIGFSGSTGGSNNIHEIRSLAIVRPTIANNDRFGTRYDLPALYNVTSNDEAPGSSLDLATVDLNPSTTAIDRTLAVAGQGTFTVNTSGTVTFTPVGTFAGVVTIPYTIRDILNTLSNEATITVDVSGADLTTSVSGPTSANPGSRVTYSVSTSNLGAELASAITPTIQLPANLSGVTVSSGSYSAESGLVTFATTASMAAGTAPITNTVNFTAPTGGTLTGTAAFQLPPGTPDPVATNNTATITTVISGSANVATLCATPGKDGPAVLGASAAPNTYFPGQDNAPSGTSTITLGNALTSANAATTGISAGDLVLIMQMQGADINTTNTAAYGSNGTAGSGNLPDNFTAGQYEYAIATNSVTATGGTLTLAQSLVNSYSNVDYTADGTMTGQRRFQVIRIPQYSSLTLEGAVTGAAWSGQAGGVLVLDVAGKTTFNTNASLDMSGKGFRGGGGKVYAGINTYTSDDYARPAVGAHGSKGEGTAGTPFYVNNDYATLLTAATTIEGYRNGSNGRGAPGNAGGGATDRDPAANNQNSGGGGGSNGGNGGIGGKGWNALTTDATSGGVGGVQFAGSAARLVLGGGGGAGSTNDGSGTDGTNGSFDGLGSSGADGGGAVLLRTGFIEGTGQILANGAAGSAVNNDGGGGGGAGGSVLLLSANTTGLNNITVSVAGGKGADANKDNVASYGPGGGGGGGLVFSNSTLAMASSVAAGESGTTTSSTTENFGATAGAPGNINPGVSFTQTNSIAGANGCLPVLTAALSTSTPNVTRADYATVNPAVYTLNVSNTGGSANTVSATITMDDSGTNGAASGLFTFNSANTAVKITLADGTVNTLAAGANGYTLNTATAGTPVFSNIDLPAGATLTISLQAAIASTAVNNRAYQTAAAVSFSDPTRTEAAGRVSPTGTFAAGGTVAGSNYIATASTAEDVTIVRPLPVELKQFSATAARQDAQLSWSTASELNNDRFVVERSLDGLTFSAIGSVRGKGTSTQPSKYSFTDAGAARLGALLYYRLKQLDFDGVASFSPVRTVSFVKAFKVDVSVYPNPSQGNATLDLTALPAGNYQVQLLDLTGRSLQVLTLAGQHEHPLQVQALPHGSYIVRVRGAAVNVALPLIRN